MKEGKVLFNEALNTFYLGLYGLRHMVNNHSDKERRNPLPPHRLLFPISSKDNTYHGLCYTSRGALAGTRNSPMGSPMKDRSDDPSQGSGVIRLNYRGCHRFCYISYTP